jgi:FlaA1/EpsC-like NDP-sugar epimerase
MDILKLIGRTKELFVDDISKYEKDLSAIVQQSSFLVLGGSGSIGQAVTKEIFKRNPLKLHVVDISENNMVELVRDIRSTYGYIDGDFRTFALDIGTTEYDAFIKNDGKYDYVFNLSALKHVRSEKDPFTLMRMINVNIYNTIKTINQAVECGAKKYFCVSSDKAANPVSMMGATKRIMEMFLMRDSQRIPISTSRFANVAFSDGSLLHGFSQRIQKMQPLAGPNDIKRYFVIPKEAGELCLLSCLLGDNRDIFFPKLSEELHMITPVEVGHRYLQELGYESYMCSTEEEARELVKTLPQQKKWPFIYSISDTTGEKGFEEFYTEKEVLDMQRFQNVGIIKNDLFVENDKLVHFEKTMAKIKQESTWQREPIIELFLDMIPDFHHLETGKFLDGKM